MLSYKLRCFDGTHTYDVIDYKIKPDTVELATSTKTIDLWETEYLIVLANEKSTLLKESENDGKYVAVRKEQYADIIKFTKKSKKNKKSEE